MARKREPVNRIHWGWAEEYTPGSVSDVNIKTAYRLTNKPHRPYTCRKNCKGNPNCLSGFGEHVWVQPIDKEAELESFISSNQRVPGTYVGLKNLGNTCYINSLLQLWFHNIPFREAVYGWNALEDKYEIAKHYEVLNRGVDLNNYQPLSSIAHLQYLFGEMQFGLTKYCDPEAFCRSLSIDVELQQDAQEFNKLYMQTLEESFQTSSNPKTNQIIQTQFRGEYNYVTKCCGCSIESMRRSDFYELELKVKNCHTILDSLQEFLSEETLTGDNQYFCSNCNKKQNATTSIRLKQLPPVLQLQLLRYEIDSAMGTRRKIHSAIQFPDNLDMSSYIDCPQNTHLYKLNAVLMHGGSTAYSGHYYAHINTAEGWHIFDDINVKKQKYLNLTNEEMVPNAEKKSSGPKLKGFRSSTSVYMLVYTKVIKDEPNESVSLSGIKLGNKKGQNVDTEKQKADGNGTNRTAEKKSGGQRNLEVEGMKLKLKRLDENAASNVTRRSPRLTNINKSTGIGVKREPNPIKVFGVRVVLRDCSNIVNNLLLLNEFTRKAAQIKTEETPAKRTENPDFVTNHPVSSSTPDVRVLKENRNPLSTDKECSSAAQIAEINKFEGSPSVKMKLEPQDANDAVSSSTLDFQNVKENENAPETPMPTHFPQSPTSEVRTPDPIVNQSKTDNVNNVNNGKNVNNDKRSQVLKENTTDNVMCDNSLYDPNEMYSEDLDRFMDEKEKENFLIKWITNHDKKDCTVDKVKNLVWLKFNSRQFIQEYGNVFLVFDEKILNHPVIQRQIGSKTPSDEHLVNNTNSLPESQLNGTVSPSTVSNASECNGSKEISLLSNGIENNVGLVNGYDKVWTEKNENDSVSSGGEKNVSRKDDDPEYPSETIGNDDITEENNQGGGGSDGDGNGEPPKNLEFLNKGDGTSTLRSKLDAAHWEMLPGYLKSALVKSREDFRKTLESQRTEIDSRIDMQNVIKTISDTVMPVDDSDDYEFINFEWLKNITKSPASFEHIDNSVLLCKHGKLSVSMKCQYKVISKEAADFLYEKFSGGPRLKYDSLCRHCVENQARKYKLNVEVGKDSKTISQLTKQLIEQHHAAYWVGKKSLKNWANYVLQGNEAEEVEDDEETESSNAMKERSTDEVKTDQSDSEKLDQSKNETDGEITSGGVQMFNEDIVCVHGDLIVDENERKLVSGVAWSVFLKYFPNCKAFERNHPPCPDCQNLAQQDKRNKEQVRERGQYERDALKDLFERKPNWDIVTADSKCYLVELNFISKWRKYIRSVNRSTVLDAPLPEEMIKPLLCEVHNLLMYDPNVDLEKFFPLNQLEWEILDTLYSCGMELKVTRSESQNLVTFIDLCTECMRKRLQAEAEENLQNSYSNASISVYKLVTNVDDGDSEDNEESSSKKRKLNNKKAKETFVPSQNSKKSAPEQVRRSTRARQSNKDRKNFPINKFTTLKDLKIMIFKKFGVIPSDQHLSVEGIDLDQVQESLKLSDADATLMNMQVRPNASIQLIADEPYPDSNMQDDTGFMQPEAGFKGTELGGR